MNKSNALILDVLLCAGLITGAILVIKNERASPPPPDNNSQVNKPGLQEQVVQLYYYNPEYDQTQGCDTNAVLPVSRKITYTDKLIDASIGQLLKGELRDSERAVGFTTEFPKPGFELKSSSLNNGLLSLEFTEVPGFTSGGSCRIRILTDQITKTAKQFPEVKEVKFLPEEIFQP
jgi:spore germination protein GerM